MKRSFTTRAEVDFGVLLSLTFGNLRVIWRQVLAYLAVVVVLAFTLPLLGGVPLGALGFVLYLAGQYWLYRSLFAARGMLMTPRYHLVAFGLLSLLLILPIMFGLALFVLPGLFLVARWIAAPAFIVARGRGAIGAAGDSWDAVRGSTIRIVGALIVIGLIVSLIGGLAGMIDGALAGIDAYGAAKPANLVQVHILPLLLLGLSVATYELLGPEDTMIEDVFG